jgi:uncharacterized membrane protein YtjA (UPF0391 family)
MGNKLNLIFFSMMFVVTLVLGAVAMVLGMMGTLFIDVLLLLWSVGNIILYLFDWNDGDFDFFLDVMWITLPIIILASGTTLLFKILFSVLLVLHVVTLVYGVIKDERLTASST